MLSPKAGSLDACTSNGYPNNDHFEMNPKEGRFLLGTGLKSPNSCFLNQNFNKHALSKAGSLDAQATGTRTTITSE